MEAMKTCSGCRRELDLTEFARNRARPDGRQYECRQCSADRYRERQARRGCSVRETVEVSPGYKYCPGCRRSLPFSEWHRNAATKDGYASYCKGCRREHAKAGHLKRTFGLTVAEYENLIAKQGGLCAICRKAPVKHLDHKHETGAVRGGLCGPCNMGLGQFRDDPVRLLAAARYLRKHEAPVVDLFWEVEPRFELAASGHAA